MKEHISKNWTYYMLFTVFLISLSIPLIFDLNNIAKDFNSFIPSTSLFAVIFKIIFDNLKHERELSLQNKQQDYILSTSSHMAEVAYDKHVKFCEEYIDIMQKGRDKMFKEGLTKNVLEIGRDLVLKRREHSPWITIKIENDLKSFEDALIKIGADESYSKIQEIDFESRKIIIEKMYKSFGMVMGYNEPLSEDEANIHYDSIVEKVKSIIGVNELTELRKKTINFAINRIKEK